MRTSHLYVCALSLLVTACKARSPAGAALAAAEAPPAAEGCAPVVKADAADVSATSLASLIARASNPACKARLLRLPLVRQTKGFTCGAASLKSILFYYGDFFAETELQRILRSHKDNGTSFMRIMRFLDALNDKAAREKLQAVYGFDSKVDLNELFVVLSDKAVQKAIKAREGAGPEFASVLKGMEELRKDAVDIDKMGSVSQGMSLTDGGAEPADQGHRVQREPAAPPAEPWKNAYSVQLFVERRPYAATGAAPAGCPASAEAPASAALGETRAMTLDDLTKAIDAGTPVLALTQAWSYSSDKDYDLAAYEKGWDSGHYVVVIGYDQDNVYYMDPYDMGHYAFLPKAEWEKRWHDYDGYLAADGSARCPGGTELHHFGLVVRRAGGPAYDQDLVTKMY